MALQPPPLLMRFLWPETRVESGHGCISPQAGLRKWQEKVEQISPFLGSLVFAEPSPKVFDIVGSMTLDM